MSSAPRSPALPQAAAQPAGVFATDDREPARAIKLRTESLSFYYGSFQALHQISLEVQANRITALIGPSGCGKSTFLRGLNRIHETIRHGRVEGRVLLDGQDVMDLDVAGLRRRVGMVFQRPNPFPKSIFDNCAYGLRVKRISTRGELPDKLETRL